MGVDLSQINNQLSHLSSEQPEQKANPVNYPRGTQFDRFGNQIFDRDKQEDEQDFEEVKELSPFGYDIFANAPQTFAPTMDIAIPTNYTVAPGARISIQIFCTEVN